VEVVVDVAANLLIESREVEENNGRWCCIGGLSNIVKKYVVVVKVAGGSSVLCVVGPSRQGGRRGRLRNYTCLKQHSASGLVCKDHAYALQYCVHLPERWYTAAVMAYYGHDCRCRTTYRVYSAYLMPIDHNS
jgi:hypothetical protein